MSSASSSGSGTDPLTVPAGGSAVLPVSSAVTISSSSSSGVGISTGFSDGVVHPVSGVAISDTDLRRLAEAVATVISRSPAGAPGPGTSGSGKI